MLYQVVLAKGHFPSITIKQERINVIPAKYASVSRPNPNLKRTTESQIKYPDSVSFKNKISTAMRSLRRRTQQHWADDIVFFRLESICTPTRIFVLTKSVFTLFVDVADKFIWKTNKKGRAKTSEKWTKKRNQTIQV